MLLDAPPFWFILASIGFFCVLVGTPPRLVLSLLLVVPLVGLVMFFTFQTGPGWSGLRSLLGWGIAFFYPAAVLMVGCLPMLFGSLGWLLLKKTSLVQVLSTGTLCFLCVFLGSLLGALLLIGFVFLAVHSSEAANRKDLFDSVSQWAMNGFVSGGVGGLLVALFSKGLAWAAPEGSENLQWLEHR